MLGPLALAVLLGLPVAGVEARPRAWVGAFEGVDAEAMRAAVRRALTRHVAIAPDPTGVPVVTGRVLRRAGRYVLWLGVQDAGGSLRAEQLYALDDPRLYTAMPAELAELVRRVDVPPPAAEAPAGRPRAFLGAVAGPRGAELRRGLARAIGRTVELADAPDRVPVIAPDLVARQGGWSLRLAVFDAAGGPVGTRVYGLSDPRLFGEMNAEIATLVEKAAQPRRRARLEPRVERADAPAEPVAPPTRAEPVAPPARAEPVAPSPAAPSARTEPVTPAEPSRPTRSADGLDEEPPDLRKLVLPAQRGGCACEAAHREHPLPAPALAALVVLLALRRRALRACRRAAPPCPRARSTP